MNTADYYNNKTEDIIAVAITSNLAEKDYIVMLSGNDLEQGTLKK
jgi:mRNA interferase MazF